MRFFAILPLLLALMACGDGKALVTGAGTVDQRSVAQERLFTAQQCLRRSSLASLRDLNNRPGVCGFEHRIITSDLLQATGVTSDGVLVLIGYANGVTYVDTCTRTGPTTKPCDASVGNQSISLRTPEIGYIGRYPACGNLRQALEMVPDYPLFALRNVRNGGFPGGNPEGCSDRDITAIGRDTLLGYARTSDGFRLPIYAGTQQNGFRLVWVDTDDISR